MRDFYFLRLLGYPSFFVLFSVVVLIQKVALRIIEITSCHTEISLHQQSPLKICQSRPIVKSVDVFVLPRNL